MELSMTAAVDAVHLEPESSATTASAGDNDRQRTLAEFFRETWSQALVAVSATEEEAQRVLSKLTNWIEMGPDEARRLGLELAERLRNERTELEDSIEVAVRRALAPFRLPSREDLHNLNARLSSLESRIDQLSALRAAQGGRVVQSHIAQ